VKIVRFLYHVIELDYDDVMIKFFRNKKKFSS